MILYDGLYILEKASGSFTFLFLSSNVYLFENYRSINALFCDKILFNKN